ncbi:sigma-70 family RNA polymerase sigma factor [Aureimonas sp. AU20]|uniref:sigma-70 family RNA polymerase sigma factor n=1 Tax=Aureimonas sp. AU20 TaxID=1349819 RepID=UPI000A9E9900|nr:sigma-70 family RNA polymerase sigma factor [Aureimonas sp. AU20]
MDDPVTADRAAKFDRLVLPRLGDGFRLARWLTGNQADAEDVMQEAALRAFLAMDRLVEDNVRAWFLTVVRNTCYSWLAKNRPGINLSVEELIPQDKDLMERGGLIAEPVASIEEALIAKDRAAWLTRAIDRLPLSMKEVVVLRDYYDLSYREIAEVSGVPIGTVMSRLARARQHLLKAIELADDDT